MLLRVPVLLALAPLAAAAAAPFETTWAVVVVHRDADRTSYQEQPLRITPLGLQQMYQSGGYYRGRYLFRDGLSGAQISGVDQFEFFGDQVEVDTPDQDIHIQAATAFMQGLYPPVNSSLFNANGAFILANNSDVSSPLDGYQYATIHTATSDSPESIHLDGDSQCKLQVLSAKTYYASEEFASLEAQKQTFYDSLYPRFLQGVFQPSEVSFQRAYDIYDYLNAGYNHNVSIRTTLSQNQLTQARWLADKQVAGLYSNSSWYPSEALRGMGGRTLATWILRQFNKNILTSGSYSKFSLAMTGFETFMSFFALAQLDVVSPDFTGLPAYASSMALELYSISSNISATNQPGFYPDPTTLRVRFMFRNGTDNPDNATQVEDLTSYSLFGKGMLSLSFEEFEMGITQFNVGLGEWCVLCGSSVDFCPSYSSGGGSNGGNNNEVTKKGGLSPAVAGVVGAIAALAFMGLILAAAMLFAGLRFHRRGEDKRSSFGGSTIVSAFGGVKHRRTMSSGKSIGRWSSWGKGGAEKLGSEVDLQRIVSNGAPMATGERGDVPAGDPSVPKRAEIVGERVGRERGDV